MAMEATKFSTAVNGYDRLVSIYDPMAALYSGGAIPRCKLAVATSVNAGERVLIVGVGAGQDAAAAVERGALLTLVDTSSKMLARAAQRCRRAGAEDLHLYQDDFRRLDFPGYFDAVIVSFFLNVFSASELPGIIGHLGTQLKPGGRILVADFSTPPENLIGRSALEFYHGLPLAVFWLLTRNAWHSVHNIPAAAAAAKLRVVKEQFHPMFGIGPRFFQSLELRRNRR